MVGIAQLVSAPDCGSGGQGFESLYPPFGLIVTMGYRQAVRHRTLTPAFAGSNPASPGLKMAPDDCRGNNGVSPSGKATDSDSVIRRFESCYPSQPGDIAKW